MIRPATEGDAAGIAALWSALIRETTVTFTSTEKTADDVAAILQEKSREDLPFLVVCECDTVRGFASYGPFRAGDGYARTVEHSILLSSQVQGRGLGRALMTDLESHARARDVHSIWAGVSAENTAGIQFHRHMGFAEIATLPEVGHKFGRYLDLVLMSKTL